jgi:hypothetical protein
MDSPLRRIKTVYGSKSVSYKKIHAYTSSASLMLYIVQINSKGKLLILITQPDLTVGITSVVIEKRNGGQR